MVEMMVTVIIIAILASVAVPMYLNQKNAANEAALRANLRTVGEQVANSQEMIGDPFKTPIDIQSVTAGSIDTTTQVPVHLVKGVSIQFKATTDGFCVTGVHESDPTDVWSYVSDAGDVKNIDCINGGTTTEPTTSPTLVAEPTPTTEPTTTPTTEPTTTPTTEPTTAPTGPTVVSYTATHTTGGMILKGQVSNVPGTVTLRASATELTGQAGWRISATPDANGNFQAELTKFTNTNPRFWQLELGTSGDAYNEILTKGKVSAGETLTGPSTSTTTEPTPAPTTTSTAPYAASYTVTWLSDGNADLKAVVKNASGQMATLRVSASPITTQTGYYYGQTIPSSGEVALASHQLKRADPVYWQLEIGSRSNVVASGQVSSANPVVSGP